MKQKIFVIAFLLTQNKIFAETNHSSSSSDFISLLFVFMLATLIGLGVITRVSRLLHTPLMSITNAISAIAVVGSLILTGNDYPSYITILGAVALFSSMTNIVSGFLITDRMLKMFKTKGPSRARVPLAEDSRDTSRTESREAKKQ